jgi:hypothetical protein
VLKLQIIRQATEKECWFINVVCFDNILTLFCFSSCFYLSSYLKIAKQGGKPAQKPLLNSFTHPENQLGRILALCPYLQLGRATFDRGLV